MLRNARRAGTKLKIPNRFAKMERQGWMYRKILFYLCLGLIVFFSIVPQDVNSLLSGMRFTKSGFFLHVFGYFVLSALACQVFRGHNIWFVLSGILILGGILEIVQYGLPSRTFNIYDLLANLT